MVGLKNWAGVGLIEEIGEELEEEAALGEVVLSNESLIFCEDVDEVDEDDDHVSKVLAVESIPICVGVWRLVAEGRSKLPRGLRTFWRKFY